MNKSVHLSEDGVYRYSLTRDWRPDDLVNTPESFNPLVFCMLNPSTADDKEDDPTIRRCIGFAKVLGYNGIVVINVFAYRATDPKQLHKVIQEGVDIVGWENYDTLKEMAMQYKSIVCAWGAQFDHEGWRTREILFNWGAKLWCLGRTKGGNPRHPLYIKADQQLEEF